MIKSIMEWTSVGVMVVYCCIYIPDLDTTNCVLYKYVNIAHTSYIDQHGRHLPCPLPPYQWMYVATSNLIVALHTPVIMAMSSLVVLLNNVKQLVSGHERHQLVLEIENSPHSC